MTEDECPTMIESWMEKEAQKFAAKLGAEQGAAIQAINNLPPWYPPPITPSPVPWGPYPWTPRLSSFDISGCAFENNSNGAGYFVHKLDPALEGPHDYACTVASRYLGQNYFPAVPSLEELPLPKTWWDASWGDLGKALIRLKEWVKNEFNALKS